MTTIVTNFDFAQRSVNGKTLSGYVLRNVYDRDVAFIHADQHPRIAELLKAYVKANHTGLETRNAREMMRALLNSEDFRSPIYDKIFRVYYADEQKIIAPCPARYVANGLPVVTDTRGAVRVLS